jgi:N-acetyl-anhydromuramyl-L-alanine amidase AmpD
VNCRSIGIALDNTYETTRPSERELQAIAKIIRERYSHVLSENIIGHSTVNIKTTCPGKWFYE